MSEKNEDHPEIDLSQFFVIPQQDVHVTDFDHHGEWILDLGGGGEGIIGQLKGRDVIAIDLNKRELEETSNESLKIVMDTKDLKFLDGVFSTVTGFFTFMYISEEKYDIIFKELWRVMKAGGELLIWEPIFKIPQEEREKKYVLISLTIHLPDGKTIQTGYGGLLRDQDESTILSPAMKIGFVVLERNVEDYTYFLRLQKP